MILLFLKPSCFLSKKSPLLSELQSEMFLSDIKAIKEVNLEN